MTEQERLLQHARRRLADLGVTRRLQVGGSSEPPSGLPAVDAAIVQLRDAIDDATASVEGTRSELRRLRAELASATAVLELHALLDGFEAASRRIRVAIEQADEALIVVEARAAAREELDSM